MTGIWFRVETYSVFCATAPRLALRSTKSLIMWIEGVKSRNMTLNIFPYLALSWRMCRVLPVFQIRPHRVGLKQRASLDYELRNAHSLTEYDKGSWLLVTMWKCPGMKYYWSIWRHYCQSMINIIIGIQLQGGREVTVHRPIRYHNLIWIT